MQANTREASVYTTTNFLSMCLHNAVAKAWKTVGVCCMTILNKWKNHFYKMKGDVGMSGHEKERKQEDAYTKIQTHS